MRLKLFLIVLGLAAVMFLVVAAIIIALGGAQPALGKRSALDQPVSVRFADDHIVFPKSEGIIWFPYAEAGRARPRQAFTI